MLKLMIFRVHPSSHLQSEAKITMCKTTCAMPEQLFCPAYISCFSVVAHPMRPSLYLNSYFSIETLATCKFYTQELQNCLTKTAILYKEYKMWKTPFNFQP